MLNLIRHLYVSRVFNIKFMISVSFCVTVFMYDEIRLSRFSDYLDVPLAYGEAFVFTASNIFSFTVYTLAVMLALSDMSTVGRTYCLYRIRLSQIKWNISMIISSGLAVAAFIVIFLLCGFIPAVSYSLSGEWSECLNIMCFENPYLSEELFGVYFSIPNVLKSFTVFEATFLSAVLLFLYMHICVLVIYAFDLIFENNISVFISILLHFIGYGLSYTDNGLIGFSLLSRCMLAENNFGTAYYMSNHFSLFSTFVILLAVYCMLITLCLFADRNKLMRCFNIRRHQT